jgi:hypothetical protein
MVQSIYSSALAANGQTYSSTGCDITHYYYEAIQVTVVETGYYQFSSNSTIDTYGYIYENDFDPVDPIRNVLSEDGYNCGIYRFQLISYLKVNTKYVLVVTTHDPNVTGVHSVLATGPNNVNFNHISEYLHFICE